MLFWHTNPPVVRDGKQPAFVDTSLCLACSGGCWLLLPIHVRRLSSLSAVGKRNCRLSWGESGMLIPLLTMPTIEAPTWC